MFPIHGTPSLYSKLMELQAYLEIRELIHVEIVRDKTKAAGKCTCMCDRRSFRQQVGGNYTTLFSGGGPNEGKCLNIEMCCSMVRPILYAYLQPRCSLQTWYLIWNIVFLPYTPKFHVAPLHTR